MECRVTARCIACGMCAYTCPDVFRMNNDTGQAVVIVPVVPPKWAGVVEEIEGSCPAGAILSKF